MAFKFFDKNLQVVVLNLSQVSRNFQINFINKLLEKFKRRRVYSSFKYNIWGIHLPDMPL